jgi:hypothetical protein
VTRRDERAIHAVNGPRIAHVQIGPLPRRKPAGFRGSDCPWSSRLSMTPVPKEPLVAIRDLARDADPVADVNRLEELDVVFIVDAGVRADLARDPALLPCGPSRCSPPESAWATFLTLHSAKIPSGNPESSIPSRSERSTNRGALRRSSKLYEPTYGATSTASNAATSRLSTNCAVRPR